MGVNCSTTKLPGLMEPDWDSNPGLSLEGDNPHPSAGYPYAVAIIANLTTLSSPVIYSKNNRNPDVENTMNPTRVAGFLFYRSKRCSGHIQAAPVYS